MQTTIPGSREGSATHVHRRPGGARGSGASARSGQGRPGYRRPSRRRAWLRRLACLMVLLVAVVGPSYGHALTVPGGGSVGVRTVEWIRGHGGAGTVAGLENLWYSHHAPPTGGKPPTGYIPASGNTAPAGPPHALAPGTAAGAGQPPSVAHLGQPPPITPLASPSLPGEGAWHPIGRQVNGSTAMYGAFLRPDAVHTSLVTGVAWMDPRQLSAKLLPVARNRAADPGPMKPRFRPL